MTREEAISVLERVAHTESKWPGTEDTLEALDMAISAIRKQERFREVTKTLEPLTLDELRQMDGEPVYIVYGDAAWWDIVSHSTKYFLKLVRVEPMLFNLYGNTWLAYRQKPEDWTV